MPSSRLTIRLPLEAMRRLETRADRLGMSPGESANAAVIEWSSLTEPRSGPNRAPGDPLPAPILLALKAGVSTATAERWLEQCGGSIDRLEELSGVELTGEPIFKHMTLGGRLAKEDRFVGPDAGNEEDALCKSLSR